MLVVDTSAWIEWILGSPPGQQIAQHLPDRQDRLVPTIVQHELSKTLTRERGETKAHEIIAFTQLCTIVPLNTEIAVAAAKACLTHKLATADAIIFATAQSFHAELLTCDRDFEDLPGVIYIPNT